MYSVLRSSLFLRRQHHHICNNLLLCACKIMLRQIFHLPDWSSSSCLELTPTLIQPGHERVGPRQRALLPQLLQVLKQTAIPRTSSLSLASLNIMIFSLCLLMDDEPSLLGECQMNHKPIPYAIAICWWAQAVLVDIKSSDYKYFILSE